MAKHSRAVWHDADCICFFSAGVCGCVFCAFVSYAITMDDDMLILYIIVYVYSAYEDVNAIHLLFLLRHGRLRSLR